MNAEQVILSRGLPKTGETYSYRAGCDGVIEAGWWKGLKNYNNRTRFITKTLDGDDIVIDLATGLMWAADGTAEGCNNGEKLDWSDALDYCNDLDFAGFTDWRLPNINELLSIINYKLSSPPISEPPFINTFSDDYFTSTTLEGTSTYAWYISFSQGATMAQDKARTSYLRSVRGGV